ncbi:MAG: hypothetical protein IJB79_07550 [Candidatus Gastranaerophilales bacterium]|nr:hypothetical protein [Candidatus Gastranaerophilales bacterium]
MTTKKNILILTIFFLMFSLIFYAKTGNMLVDFSRETFIPFQMNNGEKLIKDIFLIYGPFGYILNSFLYLFGPNLNILLFEAHIVSYLILISFYFILENFLSKKATLAFSLAFLAISIFSNSTFSFVLPYSFSTLLGVLGVYFSLYCLLYNKKTMLFLSLGLIFCNKIELFIPIFIISLAFLIYSKKSFKKNFCYIFVFPFVCLIYFLFNKISLDDIFKNYFYLKAMLDSKSLKYLYEGMGTFFNFEYFKYNILLSAKTLGILTISYLIYLIKKPALAYSFLIIGFCLINTNFALNLIGFFAILVSFLSYKKGISKEEIILLLFALILCSKSFFAINSLSYSNFGYILIIFYTFLQLQKIIDKTWLINSIMIFFILNFIGNLGFYISNQKGNFKTKIGKIWIKKEEETLFKTTNKYIEKNIKKNENFIVLPEGQIFNLIHKKNHNFSNSTFTPLDFETFGEKNIIKTLQNNKTDYIIFYPRNTFDYGAKTICYDYAVDFCKFIVDNYTQVASIKDKDKVVIFKIKK